MDSNEEILKLIQDRFQLGKERYGHGLTINHDTRKWGTKEDSWKEMALEEMLDGMIYITAQMIRKKDEKEERDEKDETVGGLKTEELSQLGLYDLQLDDGIIAVEWANKAFEEFPEESLNINIKYSKQNNTRKITLSSSHQRYNKILKKLEDNFIT